MNLWTLIRRSFAFNWRSQLGLLLGTAIAAAVLCGALAVGDSVRATLLERARNRTIGSVAAIHDTDRFFRQDLSRRLTEDQGKPIDDTRAVTALALPATARRQDNQANANRIQVIGVNGDEWRHYLRQKGQTNFAPAAQQVWLNRALAERLKPNVGDTLILRIHKPSALSQDAVISPRNESSVALRLVFAGTILPATGGDISFQAGQSAPLNAFVNLDELAKAAGLSGRANWLLASEQASKPEEALVKLNYRLDQIWQLDDAELSLRTGKTADGPQWVELISRRIFLDQVTSQAALGAAEQSPSTPLPILTYLANGLAAGGRLTPYSMVTAAGAPYTPANLQDDEIVINDWLAADLQTGPGDTIAVTHYRVDAGAQLLERTNRFRVRSVVPMTGPFADRTLMPEFPGLAKADSTHDWDAGFDLVHQIRDKDEAYWRKWRGTPKAYISLAAGTNLWSNRFGNLTSIRWPVTGPTEGAQTAIRDSLRKRLRPAQLGLKLELTTQPAVASAEGGQDFGQLFLGFSFFLILSALSLVSLLFRLALLRRADELGILLAVGWPPKRVASAVLGEALLLAAVGSALGAVAGLGYGQLIILALNTIWRGAIAGAGLDFHFSLMNAAIGMASSLLMVLLTVWLIVRRAVRRPAREILQEGLVETLPSHPPHIRRWIRYMPAGLALAGLGLAAVSFGVAESERPGLTSGAGFLLLIGSLWEFRHCLLRGPKPSTRPSFASLAARAPIRNPSRSVTTAGLIACATFLIVAVGANKQDATRNASSRNSGTGGFALWGESALPVNQDLNSAKGLEFYSLNAAKLAGMQVVPMKVLDGDEASCLNLNRAQRPRLLGLDPAQLANRKAFSFTDTLSTDGVVQDWKSLLRPSGPGNTVRGIVDANSLEWSLHKNVGDTIEYLDESGQSFQVLIVGAVANSILQGSVLISDTDFVQRYPGSGGYRMFLIDAPPGQAGNIGAELTRGLGDLGFESIPAASRLAAFNAVENTYLNTFEILGGLGLLLGSAGLGIVVMRNVAERRAEFGLLRAIGYSIGTIRRMVLIEHGALLIIGLGIGTLCALVAILPALLTPGPETDWLSLASTLVSILVCGLVFTWQGARISITGQVTEALRGE